MQNLEKLIDASLRKISEAKIDIYSYAVYFDHESKRRISICVDTKENSLAAVKRSNEWTEEYFIRFLEENDGDSIVNFSARSGRNYSLGDFKFRNLVEIENEEDLDFSNSHTILAIKAIVSRQDEILKLSSEPDDVLFSCSSKDDEYGVSWFRIVPGGRVP